MDIINCSFKMKLWKVVLSKEMNLILFHYYIAKIKVYTKFTCVSTLISFCIQFAQQHHSQ
jgi:hypothetical protein